MGVTTRAITIIVSAVVTSCSVNVTVVIKSD
jgi:hypothetical protein